MYVRMNFNVYDFVSRSLYPLDESAIERSSKGAIFEGISGVENRTKGSFIFRSLYLIIFRLYTPQEVDSNKLCDPI